MALTRHELFQADRPHTITLDIFDSSGDRTDLDGNCSYSIIDASGGTVDSGVATNAGTGIYQIEDIVADDPNFWTITWSGFLNSEAWSTRTFAEPTGSVLFIEDQFRAFNDDQFSSTSTYPDDAIVAARDAVTEQLERWTGRSWVERHCRIELPGNGSYQIALADGQARTSAGDRLYRPGRLQDIDRLLSVTVGSSSQTLSQIKIISGHLHKTSSTWLTATSSDPLNVKVEYVYGQPYPVDSVDRIAMLLAADRLRETVLSDRVTTWSDEGGGTYRIETPGRAGNVSSIPEVNEWVKAHRSPLLSV